MCTYATNPVWHSMEHLSLATGLKKGLMAGVVQLGLKGFIEKEAYLGCCHLHIAGGVGQQDRDDVDQRSAHRSG